jgi:hypothetical protein
MGTRVWYRFGCPMAAFLGPVQKLVRSRITVTKDGQPGGAGWGLLVLSDHDIEDLVSKGMV